MHASQARPDTLIAANVNADRAGLRASDMQLLRRVYPICVRELGSLPEDAA